MLRIFHRIIDSFSFYTNQHLNESCWGHVNLWVLSLGSKDIRRQVPEDVGHQGWKGRGGVCRESSWRGVENSSRQIFVCLLPPVVCFQVAVSSKRRPGAGLQAGEAPMLRRLQQLKPRHFRLSFLWAPAAALAACDEGDLRLLPEEHWDRPCIIQHHVIAKYYVDTLYVLCCDMIIRWTGWYTICLYSI